MDSVKPKVKEEPQKETSTKKAKITTALKILVILSVMGYTGYTIYNSVDSYASLNSTGNTVITITQNWAQPYISGITVVIDEDCPTNFEKAYYYEWGGTYAGCDCTSLSTSQLSTYNTTAVSNGTCSTTLKNVGCTDIAAIPSKNFTYWGIYNNKKTTICVKRSTVTYQDSYPMASGFGCSDGWTNCGSTKTRSYVFCVPSGSSCPLVSMQLTWYDNATLNSNTCTVDTNCLVFQVIGTKWQMLNYSTSGESGLPIVEFALNQYKMCPTASEKNNYPGRTPYILDVDQSVGCTTSDDITYWNVMLDMKPEKDLFTANEIFDSVSALPNREFDDKYTWSIYGRRYIEWDGASEDCRNKFGEFIESGTAVSKILKVQLANVIVTSVSAGIVSVIIPIIELMMMHKKFANRCAKTAKAKKIINWGAKLMKLPIIIVAIIFVVESARSFTTVVGNSCIDSNFSSYVVSLADELGTVQENNIIFLCTLAGYVILEVVLTKYEDKIKEKALKCVEKCKKKNKVPSRDSPREKNEASPQIKVESLDKVPPANADLEDRVPFTQKEEDGENKHLDDPKNA